MSRAAQTAHAVGDASDLHPRFIPGKPPAPWKSLKPRLAHLTDPAIRQMDTPGAFKHRMYQEEAAQHLAQLFGKEGSTETEVWLGACKSAVDGIYLRQAGSRGGVTSLVPWDKVDDYVADRLAHPENWHLSGGDDSDSSSSSDSSMSDDDEEQSEDEREFDVPTLEEHEAEVQKQMRLLDQEHELAIQQHSEGINKGPKENAMALITRTADELNRIKARRAKILAKSAKVKQALKAAAGKSETKPSAAAASK
jgi:hypothetical protein